MGCCSSTTVEAAPEDPPVQLTNSEGRRWAEIDEYSFVSSAISGDEPSGCMTAFKAKFIILHAYMLHGVTGTMDTTPDGKVYEAVEITKLRPRQIKRIGEWLAHVKQPVVRDPASPPKTLKRRGSVQSFTTASSRSSDSSNSDNLWYGARRHPMGFPDGIGEPPLEGDLPSDSESIIDQENYSFQEAGRERTSPLPTMHP